MRETFYCAPCPSCSFFVGFRSLEVLAIQHLILYRVSGINYFLVFLHMLIQFIPLTFTNLLSSLSKVYFFIDWVFSIDRRWNSRSEKENLASMLESVHLHYPFLLQLVDIITFSISYQIYSIMKDVNQCWIQAFSTGAQHNHFRKSFNFVN